MNRQRFLQSLLGMGGFLGACAGTGCSGGGRTLQPDFLPEWANFTPIQNTTLTAKRAENTENGLYEAFTAQDITRHTRIPSDIGPQNLDWFSLRKAEVTQTFAAEIMLIVPDETTLPNQLTLSEIVAEEWILVEQFAPSNLTFGHLPPLTADSLIYTRIPATNRYQSPTPLLVTGSDYGNLSRPFFFWLTQGDWYLRPATLTTEIRFRLLSDTLPMSTEIRFTVGENLAKLAF
jgi:hypothetical protein